MGTPALPAVGPSIRAGQPGYVVAIADAAASLTGAAHGVADVRTGAPLRVGSVCYVGSIAKQFVAACVALLLHAGALDVYDPVTRYVDDLPAWWRDVHVQHLLHHTGGVPPAHRPAGDLGAEGVPAWGNDDLLAAVRAIPEPLAAPGDAHVYSGDGYLVLAEVIARAASQPLDVFAREQLFDPLGMADTFFRPVDSTLPEAAARGHFHSADGVLHVEPARFHAVGSGGLWTTAADLATWGCELMDGRLEGGRLARTLTEHGRLGDGRPIHYGWGVSVRTHRGARIVSHGGTFPGWAAKLVVFPEHRRTFVCLANTEGVDVSSLTFRLADAVLDGELDPTAPHADDTLGR